MLRRRMCRSEEEAAACCPGGGRDVSPALALLLPPGLNTVPWRSAGDAAEQPEAPTKKAGRHLRVTTAASLAASQQRKQRVFHFFTAPFFASCAAFSSARFLFASSRCCLINASLSRSFCACSVLPC